MRLQHLPARLWISSAPCWSQPRILRPYGPHRFRQHHPHAVVPSLVLFSTFTTAPTNQHPNKDEEDGDGNSASYLKTYQLQGETMANSKSGVTVTTNTGHTLQTDLPKRMGGQDTAAQPVETLLAAWMGCTQATALFVGRHMQPSRLLLDRLVFQVKAVRDERGALHLPLLSADDFIPVPSRLLRIDGSIVVYRRGGQSISDSEMKILHEQTELRCPLANMMIASGCQIKVNWIDGSTVA